MKRILLLFVITIILATASLVCADTPSPRKIRIAAFNFYPTLFQARDGSVQGFYVDFLSEIAKREGWTIEYIYGNWADGLARIKSGEVDVLTNVALTAERTQFMDYGKVPLITVWSELYAPNGSPINNIRDVQNKKIALMKGDFNAANFKNLVEKFGIPCTYVEYGNFEDVFKAISARQVDAGIVNNTFGTAKRSEYDLKPTDVIFNPFDIFFTVAKGKNSAVLATLDRYLEEWRKNESSPYHQARERWSHKSASTIRVVHPWLKKAAVISGSLLCIAVGFVVLLRIQVRRKTMETQKYTDELHLATRQLEEELAERQVAREALLKQTAILEKEIAERKLAEEALLESESRWKFALEGAGDGVWDWNIQTGEAFYSLRYKEMLGFEEDEIGTTSDEWLKRIHPEDVPGAMAALQPYLEGRTGPARVDFRMLCKDGSWKWILSRGMVVSRDSNGKPLRMIGTNTDITGRKQAEQEVREASEKVRLILDSTAEAIYGIDLEGKCTFCNVSFLKMTGHKQLDQLLGANMHELIHHTHADGSHCEINNCRIFQAARHGIETHVDGEVFWRADGTSFPAEYWSYPIYKNGDIVGSVVTFVDITQRKQAEEALKLERDSTRNILATVEAMIVALDPEGRITLVNRKACEILGYREDELLGQDWFATCLPHSIDVDQVRAVFKMSLAGNLAGSEYYENPVRSRSGEERLIAWHNSSIRDKDGNIIGGLSAGEDITERRKAEEEKHVLEQQFEQTQKLESLGVLAGGIAHDFNNILAIIMGYCSLTKMDYKDAEKHIPEIEKAAERAAALCRQMLAYAGKGSLTQAQVNTWMLVDEMVSMLKTTIQQNVAVKAELGTDIPFIMGDASQIRQVVMNLIINAAEAIGDAEGEIDVKLLKTEIRVEQAEKDHLGFVIAAGRYILFEVTDNGCGMDEETSRKIFEPFYTTKFTGRGLGMSAVLGIIKAHNGALQLESQPGQGTTFKVYLPARFSKFETEELQQKAASAPWHDSGTILLAEDEERVKSIAITLLQELGFTVLDAENGKDALELYQQNAADISLVITDMGMPVMNGYELFYKLKQLNPHLPIIISSGFGEGDIYSKIPREEIAGLINKPYNFDQLREVLRGVVEGAK